MNLPNEARVSCEAFKSVIAWLNECEADRFATSINVSEVAAFCESNSGLSTNRFTELTFQSTADEAGFLLVAHALDFGSGFRTALHKHRNGKGAWLTIRAGLVNLGKVDSSCKCSWLSSLSLQDICNYFDLHHEELLPLAKQLEEIVHELGNNLSALNFTTPGQFIQQHAIHGATHLVNTLVTTFPAAFLDEYELRGHKVCFYKKAQLVVSEIHMRFFKEVPLYCFSDIDNLTAFVDNVVVAMMRMTGVVQCNPELAEWIAASNPLLKGSEEEVALRAASLHAVEYIVNKLRTFRETDKAEGEDSSIAINSQMLCNYLWGHLGKVPENRSFPRHLTPSTSFY